MHLALKKGQNLRRSISYLLWTPFIRGDWPQDITFTLLQQHAACLHCMREQVQRRHVALGRHARIRASHPSWIFFSHVAPMPCPASTSLAGASTPARLGCAAHRASACLPRRRTCSGCRASLSPGRSWVHRTKSPLQPEIAAD